MKKILSTLVIFLTTFSFTFASSNLWEFYKGNLPSIFERAKVYEKVFDDKYEATAEQNIKFLNYLEQGSKEEMKFGSDSNLFFGGFPYYLAGSGITSSATSFTLTSLTIPQNSYPIQDSDLSSTFYITFEPGSKNRQEFASCTTVGANTGGNVAISGCTRGLSAISPYTASTTQRFSHAGGTSVIFSNSPSFYDQLTSKGNDEAITGLWTFNTVLPTSTITATTSSQFVIKGLLDATANQGAATSTETSGGIVELATLAEVASSTASTVAKPLVVQAQHATSTRTVSGTYLVMSENDGKINQNWLDLTEDYTWSGANTFNTATTTLSATTSISATVASPLRLNGVNFNIPSTEGASSTVLMTNGSGSLTWNPYDWIQLGEQILTGTNSTTTVSITSKKDLMITASIPSVATTQSLVLEFNDNTSGYGYSVNADGTYLRSTGVGILLNGIVSGTTSPQFYNIFVHNTNGIAKYISWQGVNVNNAGTPPYNVSGSATWNNTAQITKIDVGTIEGAGQLPIGARLTVYGKKD